MEAEEEAIAVQEAMEVATQVLQAVAPPILVREVMD